VTDKVTVRQLSEEEQVELSRKVRHFPRLTRVSRGKWTLVFRPTRRSTACVTGSLPSVLSCIAPIRQAIRVREARESAEGDE
jgi:hypothetical protein